MVSTADSIVCCVEMGAAELRLLHQQLRRVTYIITDNTNLCFLLVSVEFALIPVLISPGGCALICRPVLMCGRRAPHLQKDDYADHSSPQ